jgi:lysophospholipase L1-like esterase
MKFLRLLCPISVILLVIAPAIAQQTAAPADITWYNLSKFPVEGKGWTKTKHPYDRLPAEAEGVVRPPVWNLSHDSAGLRYRFITDADTLRGRWKLRKPNLALPHMPATGVSGLDLYVRTGDQWHWIGAGRPEHELNETTLASGLKREKREYILYLPLYNGVESVEIGVPPNATLEAAPNRYAGKKPAVFYGTSILQGGCAARPGMAYPSIIGRMIDWPTINLGFSGNGKTEPEVAKLLTELDPAVYVMDSLPNLDVAEVGERVQPFVKTLRAAHPATPIILVENVTYTNSAFVAAREAKVTGANELLRKLYDKMRASGDKNVYYVPTTRLLGADGEDTVDGTHPTDLGFLRMAQGMTPVVRQALNLH